MASPKTAPSGLTTETAVFRRFNRMYTRLIGTLNEKLLDTEYSLPEARVLYEVATRSAPKASEIAEGLGIDAGYLSRLLTRFERDGLLQRKTSAEDGRYAELILTARGKSAFKKLNALSDDKARAALDGLAPTARLELIRCMQSIENILMKVDRSRPPYVLRPHRVGDMGWIVYRESVGYAEQYGWDGAFEALAAKIVGDFVTNFDQNRDRCWIAEVDGQNVGHVFLVKHPSEPQTAKLRLLFVEPSARGMGLGDALVNECICFARTAGYRKIVLWTQSILTAAHRIYARAGFHLVKEESHHSFGHDLIGQEWELDLS
ncbi:MAG TPA: helix-turn-helix domain-containing GNAT family N-acetyltransferase [Bryobacteraceae bacterium]|jgi:DNA-binding MarR family transcriptional regulator/GNAT superfamily N-acetyltransferase|nr:helix-turn-helix domain-containing GNAT family N-acetyltransferase [Bryobacteraceae bacterium]